MSGLLSWFGGGAKKDTTKDAILDLRAQLDMLGRRENHLRTLIAEQKKQAQGYLEDGQRDAAKHALRRKKRHEESLTHTHEQILSLEFQIYQVEDANITKTTFQAMKGASNALKNIHDGITVTKVEKAMDELHDQEEISQEISQAILRNNKSPVDEAELDAELAELEQQGLDNKMLAVGPVPRNANQLPDVPVHVPAKKVEIDDAEEELRKLEAEMAM